MASQSSSQVVITSATTSSAEGKCVKQAVYPEWTDDETRHIVNWLSVRDKAHDYANYHLYRRRRPEALQRILSETDLSKQKPGVTAGEISAQLTAMFSCYRRAMDFCVDAGWGEGEGVGAAEEEDLDRRLATMTDEMRSEAVIEKCFFYYNFHVMLGGDSTRIKEPCRLVVATTPRESDRSAVVWWRMRGQKPEELVVPRLFEWELSVSSR